MINSQLQSQALELSIIVEHEASMHVLASMEHTDLLCLTKVPTRKA